LRTAVKGRVVRVIIRSIIMPAKVSRSLGSNSLEKGV